MAIPSQKSFEMASKLETLISCIGGPYRTEIGQFYKDLHIFHQNLLQIGVGCLGKGGLCEGVGNLPRVGVWEIYLIWKKIWSGHCDWGDHTLF